MTSPTAPTLTPDQAAHLQRAAVKKLWELGDLRYKLDETQRKMRSAIDASQKKTFFINSARRVGKTYMLFGLAMEECLRKKNARVIYAAPFASDAANIVTDISQVFFDDCPPESKPEYSAFERSYRFKNGSILRLRGINSEAYQQIRGLAADLFILDEAGSMDHLKDVVTSVVLPTLISTNGRLIIATTPAVTPDHDAKRLYDAAVRDGACATFTIRDAVRYPMARREEFLIAMGEDPEEAPRIMDGAMQPRTTAAKREYFCDWVTDISAAVVPEFTREAEAEICPPVLPPRPRYFDAYVSVDLGYADQTAILYGYWDFVRAKLVIEAEDILDSPNTDEIHLLVKQRERELWGDQRPYLRITDIEPRFVADMANIYKMTFHQARRTDSLGAVNLLRTDVQNRVLELGDVPVLKEQLRSGTWNRKKNDFTRTAEHHLDALAALKYLVRAVNRSRNPNPADPYSGRPVAGQPFWHPPQGSGSKTIPDWADLTPDTPLGRKLKSRRRNRRG